MAIATLSGLENPDALLFDSQGDLYVANSNIITGNTITVFAATSSPNRPTIVTSGGALLYAANSGPQAIDSGVALTDAGSTTIASATVTISSGYVSGEDVLGFTNHNGISGMLIGNSLILSGTASVAAYQSALESVTYSDNAHDASTNNRTISFLVNDGTASSNVARKIVSPQADIPTQLVIASEPPATVSAGSGFGLSVAVEDAQGNVVTGFSGNVTATLASNPGGSVLGGTTTVAVSNGVATFSNLVLNRIGSGYALQLSSSGFSSQTTSSIPGRARQLWLELAILGEPPTVVTAGNSFALTVIGEDSAGNVVSNFNGNITVALLGSVPGATLGGTLTVQAANNVAVFSDLSLTKAGVGYSFLQVTEPGLLPAASTPLSIAAAPATQLAISSQPSGTVGAGNTFAISVEAFGHLRETRPNSSSR